MFPTPEEERDLERSRWRRMPVAAQIVFFLLTLLAIAALYWLVHLLGLSERYVPAMVSIGTAEWLILRRRFWRTGVESALWIGGLLAFIFALPPRGTPEAILVFCAAFAIAGWRLRNALFGSAAVILLVVYVAAKEWQSAAMLAGATLALAAAIATAHVWRRPSTELLSGVLAMILPIAAYAVHSFDRGSQLGVVALFLALAAVDLTLGIYFRINAPLIAAPVCITIAVVEAHDFIPLAIEWELIIGGIVTLAVGAAIMRGLRGRTTGLVVTPMKNLELAEALQIGAMLSMPATADGAAPSRGSGGGEFGGAGASGDY